MNSLPSITRNNGAAQSSGSTTIQPGTASERWKKQSASCERDLKIQNICVIAMGFLTGTIVTAVIAIPVIVLHGITALAFVYPLLGLGFLAVSTSAATIGAGYAFCDWTLYHDRNIAKGLVDILTHPSFDLYELTDFNSKRRVDIWKLEEYGFFDGNTMSKIENYIHLFYMHNRIIENERFERRRSPAYDRTQKAKEEIKQLEIEWSKFQNKELKQNLPQL